MPDGTLDGSPGAGEIESRIAALREFGRFYTRRIGALQPEPLGSDLPLAARRIYADAGWRMTKAEPYRGFGHDLVGETWEKPLT